MPPNVEMPVPGVRRQASASQQRLQGNTYRAGQSFASQGTTVKSGGARMGSSFGTMKPTTTDVKRNISNRFNPSFSQQATGSMKPSSVGGSTSFSQGGSQVAQKMAKSSPSQMVTKMSGAGRAAMATPKATVAAASSVAKGIAAKVAGRALGVAGLAVPDSTKTEPGNPVFRKTDTGKTQVAGYRSSTTPSASVKNTQTGMVGSMSRRGELAPSVKNQELPSKIAPVQTKEPGTMSAPVAKPAAAPKTEPSSFKQAFSQARKEAGSMGAKSTGQFKWTNPKTGETGTYQSNIRGKGTAKAPEEKFVPMSQQKVTSVGKSSTPATASSATKADTAPKNVSTDRASYGPGRQGLTRVAGLTTAGTSSGSLSPTPIKQQDTGMKAAEKPDTFSSVRLNPERTPTTTTRVPTGVPDIAGSAAKPKNATSDTGGFISQNKPPETAPAPAPEVKASVTAAPEPSYSADSPAGKAWANRGKFGGTQQEEKKMVAESYVSVGDNKYRIV